MSRKFIHPPAGIVNPLWAEYVRTRSETLRNRLVEIYINLVEGVAFKLLNRLPQEVEEGDLIQWGRMGLMQAVEKFEPARGWKFNTYAQQRIKGAMLDGLRNSARANRCTLDFVKQLNEAEERLAVTLDRAPTPDELTAAMNITPERLRHLRGLRSIVGTLSIDCPIPRSYTHARETFERDTLADTRGNDPHTLAQRKEVFEAVIQHMLKEFRLTDALVIRLYYIDEMVQSQIAPILGLCECRISQLRNRALRSLKAHFIPAA
jgi:RNA polymerase sigma factor for flagellar operon FliA